MSHRLPAGLSIALLLAACQPTHTPDKPASFGEDLRFLQQHDSVILLRRDAAEVLVSPKYQGKVFTSTAGGEDGPSFGWIHYKAFDGPLDPHMNAYGGENRLWLGPEGGRFSCSFRRAHKWNSATGRRRRPSTPSPGRS